MTNRLQRLKEKEKAIAKDLPPIKEVMRGTFIKWYGKCKNPNCKCHRGKKHRHGPYYRVSYSKGGRAHHVYVPLEDKEKAKLWVDNYEKIWKAMEEISAINIKIIRLKK